MDPVAVGIDIGGTKLVAATVAADGTVLTRHRRRTPARGEADLVGELRELIAELTAEHAVDLPVGIGIAGLVSPDGDVRYGPNISIRDLQLRKQLADVTSATITVVNDASAAALGEQRVGAAQGLEDVLMFTLGTGVGGGVVLGGRLVLGRFGFAGELGHLVVCEGGRACACGNRGCVEAYASGSAIGLTARERLVDRSIDSPLRDEVELTGREVTAAARGGDRFAQFVLEDAGRWLGVAAAGLVNALDAELVLVGGGAAASSAEWLLPAARAAMAERLVGADWREPPPVELAQLGDDAGMVGAALLAAERHASTSR